MKTRLPQDMSERWGLWLNFAGGAGKLIYSNFDYKTIQNAPGWRLP